jgi:hypothetical protein
MAEISKTFTKVTKIIVKYVPFIIAIGYLLMAIFSCFGLTFALLSIFCRYSILSFICLLAMSILLKFCIWHRLPLYYSASIDIINTIDYYIVIPVSNKLMLLFYLVITGIFILIGMYLKEKYNEKVRIIKDMSSESNR